MIQLFHFLQFPEEVEATGISYLKRFYLKNTVMDWYPKNLMCGNLSTHISTLLTCMFTIG